MTTTKTTTTTTWSWSPYLSLTRGSTSHAVKCWKVGSGLSNLSQHTMSPSKVRGSQQSILGFNGGDPLDHPAGGGSGNGSLNRQPAPSAAASRPHFHHGGGHQRSSAGGGGGTPTTTGGGAGAGADSSVATQQSKDSSKDNLMCLCNKQQDAELLTKSSLEELSGRVDSIGKQVEDLSLRLSKDISSIFAILTDEGGSSSVGAGGGQGGQWPRRASSSSGGLQLQPLPPPPAAAGQSPHAAAASLREAYAQQRQAVTAAAAAAAASRSSPREVSPAALSDRRSPSARMSAGAGGGGGSAGSAGSGGVGWPGSDTAVNVLRSSPTSAAASRRKALKSQRSAPSAQHTMDTDERIMMPEQLSQLRPQPHSSTQLSSISFSSAPPTSTSAAAAAAAAASAAAAAAAQQQQQQQQSRVGSCSGDPLTAASSSELAFVMTEGAPIARLESLSEMGSQFQMEVTASEDTTVSASSAVSRGSRMGSSPPDV